MTNEQISDAILRRIGDQASDGRRIDAKRLTDGSYRLTHAARLVGSMSVRSGRITIDLAARGAEYVVPAIPNHLATEAEIDDVARVLWEEVGHMA